MAPWTPCIYFSPAALRLPIRLYLPVLGLVPHLGTCPQCLFDLTDDLVTLRSMEAVTFDLTVPVFVNQDGDLLGHDTPHFSWSDC